MLTQLEKMQKSLQTLSLIKLFSLLSKEERNNFCKSLCNELTNDELQFFQKGVVLEKERRKINVFKEVFGPELSQHVSKIRPSFVDVCQKTSDQFITFYFKEVQIIAYDNYCYSQQKDDHSVLAFCNLIESKNYGRFLIDVLTEIEYGICFDNVNSSQNINSSKDDVHDEVQNLNLN